MAWFESTLEALGDADPDSDKIYLPCGHTRFEFYQGYRKDMKDINPDRSLLGSFSFFRRVLIDLHIT